MLYRSVRKKRAFYKLHPEKKIESSKSYYCSHKAQKKTYYIAHKAERNFATKRLIGRSLQLRRKYAGFLLNSIRCISLSHWKPKMT